MAAVQLEVFGYLKDVSFHAAKCCAQDLYDGKEIKSAPHIHGMTDIEWDIFVTNKKRELKGEAWAFEGKAMTFVDGKLIGNTNEFISWAATNFYYSDYRPEALYIQLADEAYKQHLDSKMHDYVFMDISIGNKFKGQLVIELFTHAVPKTCANFLNLCTGGKGLSKESGYQLNYQGSIFHRVVKNGWIQGGDIWMHKGNGSESIYGLTFDDENFSISHDRRGIVGMANKGSHTNGSQFYITLQPAKWMDTKHVAFGCIIEGSETLKHMESVETVNDRPLTEITITKTGLYSSKY